MDHSAHTRLQPAELTDATLIGAAIYGAEDEKVGTISHLHQEGAATQVVVDVGGFLGLAAKPVLVGLGELDMMMDAHGNVHGVTTWTKDHLKAFPEHRE